MNDDDDDDDNNNNNNNNTTTITIIIIIIITIIIIIIKHKSHCRYAIRYSLSFNLYVPYFIRSRGEQIDHPRSIRQYTETNKIISKIQL